MWSHFSDHPQTFWLSPSRHWTARALGRIYGAGPWCCVFGRGRPPAWRSACSSESTDAPACPEDRRVKSGLDKNIMITCIKSGIHFRMWFNISRRTCSHPFFSVTYICSSSETISSIKYRRACLIMSDLYLLLLWCHTEARQSPLAPRNSFNILMWREIYYSEHTQGFMLWCSVYGGRVVQNAT